MAQGALNKQKTLFASKLDFNFRKKLVKCYMWSIVLYGAATWTLRRVDPNTWKVLKCGTGVVWRRSSEPIVRKMKKYYIESRRKGILYVQHEDRRPNELVTSCVGTAF
jgi:adenine specific DNA methylase Mod